MRDSPEIGSFVPRPARHKLCPAFQLCILYLFFLSQKLKYQNKKYIKNCDWHLKIHLRSRHVVKITNRHSRREVFFFFFYDNDCVDGAKDVRTSSSARAPPMEMVEDTRKNTVFSFH